MSFWDSIGKIVDEGMDKSRVAYDKTREYAKQGSIRAGILTLQSRRADLINKLGTLTFDKMIHQGINKIERDDTELSNIFDKIKHIDNQIQERQKELDSFKIVQNKDYEASNSSDDD